MENKIENVIELGNGAKIVLTSKEKVDEHTNFGQPVLFSAHTGDSVEIERKFIIMSRIAVLLGRKGLIADVTIYPSECNAGSFCQIIVQDAESTCVLEFRDSNQATEQELLDWWSAIENGVE